MSSTNEYDEDANGGETPEVPDPFDPQSLAVEADSSATFSATRVILQIPVQKPPKQTFIRVNPDPDYQVPLAIVRDETEQNTTYAAAPRIAAQLPGEFRTVQMRTAITRQGGLFLWPLNLPSEDGSTNSWNESATAIADLAEREWVRVKSNRQMGAYEALRVIGAAPPDPVWPDMTLRDILEIAFGGGRLIDDEGHPFLQKLLGRV